MKTGALVRLAWTVTVGAAYFWPLDRPAAPTSTFGEYRSRHFHAGIDLSTQETIGLPVRALEAGEVVRVRTSGVGYGRGLYLRLADGRTAMYGHLDGFAPDLARWVAAVQDSTGQYEQDLAPPAGRFRYARGALVAYSGGSGAGPPHLHVELRAGDTALNPLTTGLAAPDRVPPTLEALWVYPASAGSRVEGGTAALRLRLRAGRAGLVRPERAVRVSGPVRLAVEGFDRTQAKPNRLALFALEAALDGSPVYEARFDSVSWLDASEAEVVFDARARWLGAGSAYSLTPPASLRCLALRRSQPAWERAAGAHELSIVAYDPEGNETRAEAFLEWEKAAENPSGRRTSGRRPALLGVDFFPDGLAGRSSRERAALAASLPPTGGEAEKSSGERTFALAPGFLGPVEMVATEGGETLATRRFTVADTEPGWVRTVRSGDGAFSVAFGAGSTFERQPVGVEAIVRAGRGARADRSPRGATLYKVEPEWLALREPVPVTLRLADAAGAGPTGLFEAEANGTRFLGGPDSTQRGVVAGKARSLGAFFALRDTVAPAVGEARLERGGRSPAPGARPSPLEVRWRTADRGSGIDVVASALAIDGRRVAVEYDPEKTAFCWRPIDPPPPGRYAYRLEAVDRLGNRATRAGTFRIP